MKRLIADCLGLLLIAIALYLVLWCYPEGQRRAPARQAVEQADDVQTATNQKWRVKTTLDSGKVIFGEPLDYETAMAWTLADRVPGIAKMEVMEVLFEGENRTAGEIDK